MTDDIFQDVGDEEVVKVKRTTSKSKRDKELDDLRQILSTYAGRAFIWRMLAQCGVYKTSFTGNSTTFFNEGKRHIGLWLLDEVFSADKFIFTKMQNEAEDRGERK